MDRGGTGPIRRSAGRSGARPSPYKLRSDHAAAAPSSSASTSGESSPPMRPEEKPSYLLCPICFDCVTEPHITKCGHSFCYECIVRSLETSDRCPKCSWQIESRNDLYPNFVLNDIVSKFNGANRKIPGYKDEFSMGFDATVSSQFARLSRLIMDPNEKVELSDVAQLHKLLEQKKQELEHESQLTRKQCLYEFLSLLLHQKREELETLEKEVQLISSDRDAAMKSIEALSRRASTPASSSGNDRVPDMDEEPGTSMEPESGLAVSLPSLVTRRKRLYSHFQDLTETYLGCRTFDAESTSAEMEEFSGTLSHLTAINKFKPLATLNYANEFYTRSSIVSSIEFDKDAEFFAIAGVTRKIKVFDYNTTVSQDVVDIHYPHSEMVCNSKISCVSWNSYFKGWLASSDYEGSVLVWDAFVGTKLHTFQEHEKRCWSVDFNHVDAKLIASGSDDCKVKLWSTNMSHSVKSIESKANVCCVEFSPTSRYHLAFGSADHCVHLYDLRNTNEPLKVFRGHQKAVSYVKFLNDEELVSASTDNQLRLWHMQRPHAVRSYSGHVNEKNFVGLTTNGDYVACGSENNSLFVYYRGFSKHLLAFQFDPARSILDRNSQPPNPADQSNDFVSAVCWRMGSNVVLAANSRGIIRVLELV